MLTLATVMTWLLICEILSGTVEFSFKNQRWPFGEQHHQWPIRASRAISPKNFWGIVIVKIFMLGFPICLGVALLLQAMRETKKP